MLLHCGDVDWVNGHWRLDNNAEVHLPFDGTKATGNGHREGGIGAIDFYTEWKSVYVDYSDKLQKAQIDRAE